MRTNKYNILTRLLILSALALGLTACGGGGSSDPSDLSNMTISGTATYTSYKLSDAGIDYVNPITKPIRGATIQLLDSSGNKILATAKTSDSGGYSFTASKDTDIRIVVYADIGNTTVIDNTSSDKLYSITTGIHRTATIDETKDINADSGWDTGGINTGEREAAPFNILDLIYEAQKKIREVDSTADAVFANRPLKVNWSIKNGAQAPLKDTAGNEDISNGGLGGASSYDSNLNLLILGKADEDTDEYDRHTILHEWFHYFEAEMSNSDSIGGGHGPEDILHPSLAFGEGFAYAFAAMILDDPLYYQTQGIGSKTVDFTNYELDSVDDSKTFAKKDKDDKVISTENVKLDGFYSEQSIIEVLWDIYDDNADDNDELALGFAPIYKVMIGGQKTTKSFTSIVSFLHHLKIQQPDSADKIDAIAQAENINMANADEFQILDNVEVTGQWPKLYTDIVPGVTQTIDDGGFVLQTWNNFGDITLDDEGGKLFNYQFFKTTIATGGCYEVRVQPITPAGTVENAKMCVKFPRGLGLKVGDDVGVCNSAGATTYPLSITSIIPEGILAFSVAAKNDGTGETPFSVLLASSPNGCL